VGDGPNGGDAPRGSGRRWKADQSAAAPALDSGALLTLQLAARNYTLRQIAALRGIDVVDVLEGLRRAVEALGAGNAREAIVEARRRRLIV
jgi:hypothetical protein